MNRESSVVYDDDGHFCAEVKPASEEYVNRVLEAPVRKDEGRSDWVWVHLANGDLLLGVFPQGETYFECEEDAQMSF